MKTGLTLQQMAAELERQQNAKRDFIADTRELRMTADAQHVTLPNIGEFGIRDHAHGQMAQHAGVPKPYYDRLRADHPDLLAMNLNTLFDREPSRRMMRMLDEQLRAFMSDRYRPLDNYDLGMAVLPRLMEFPDIEMASSQLTERRFYMKFVFPRLEAEIKVGDVVQMGVEISNSEVGAGSLRVSPLILRLACLNGMTVNEYGQRKYHVGKRAEEMDSAYELYSDDTRRKDDAAFFAKVNDTIAGVLRRDVFERIVGKLRDATEQRIEGRPEKVVEVTVKRLGLAAGQSDNILRHLIDGGDLSRYGMVQAITRASQDVEDYDDATSMEAAGGRIIELSRSEWTDLAKAA